MGREVMPVAMKVVNESGKGTLKNGVGVKIGVHNLTYEQKDELSNIPVLWKIWEILNHYKY